MALLNPEDWQSHIDIVNDFHNDAFQQDVIWQRTIRKLSSHGEDSGPKTENIILKGLLQYNNFRSWPINKDEITGQVDNESNLLYLNLQYLKDNNYLNSDGQFIFDPGMDKFIINGVKYSPKGDSQAAQASDTVLFHFIVLKREEVDSGNNPY